MGGGFAGILMPLLFKGIVHHGTPEFLAWRWSFFVPATIQVLLAVCTLLLAQVTEGLLLSCSQLFTACQQHLRPLARLPGNARSADNSDAQQLPLHSSFPLQQCGTQTKVHPVQSGRLSCCTAFT